MSNIRLSPEQWDRILDVAAPACTLARKRIAGVLSRPSYGLTALGPNGDCASRIRELEQRLQTIRVGLTKGSGNHQHFCDDADLEYLIIDSTVVRAHLRGGSSPKKGGQAAQALGRSRRSAPRFT